MQRYGLLYALCAYFMWGILPLYWKQLAHIGDLEILSHRTVWAAIFMLILMRLRGNWRPLLQSVRQPKVVLLSLLAAMLVGWNWYFYIYAVNNNFIIEASMGYFINPLINVLFGAVFLSERLRKVQWLAIAVAACGVLYLIIGYQKVPYIALVLATSFAAYGLVKKYIKLNALHSMTLETVLLFVPGLIVIGWQTSHQTAAFGSDLGTGVLLILAGVCTVTPLIFFSAATQRISLSLLGITQYLAPTLQLLIGIWVYNEPFSVAQLITFSCIWLGLVIFSLESLHHQQQRIKKSAAITTIG